MPQTKTSFGTKQTPDALFLRLHLALKSKPLNQEKKGTASDSTQEDLGFTVFSEANRPPSNGPTTSFENNEATVCYHDLRERIESPNKMKQYSNTSSKQISILSPIFFSRSSCHCLCRGLKPFTTPYLGLRIQAS